MKHILVLLALVLTSCAGNFNFKVDNDYFSGNYLSNDAYYTHGTAIENVVNYDKSNAILKTIGETLPQFAFGAPVTDEKPDFFVFELGQEIRTPNTIKDPNPLPDDMPWSGWLYTKYGRLNENANYRISSSLYTGVVGPWSFAEDCQTFVHKDLGMGSTPMGWDNQLKNEFGIYAEHTREFLDYLDNVDLGFVDLQYDVLTNSKYRVGNVYTDMELSKEVQFGYNLQPFKHSEKVSAYILARPMLSLVGQNIFYDGNTFRDSQSVDKRISVAALRLGFAVEYAKWMVRYQINILTKEFETQDDDLHAYGQVFILKYFD